MRSQFSPFLILTTVSLLFFGTSHLPAAVIVGFGIAQSQTDGGGQSSAATFVDDDLQSPVTLTSGSGLGSPFGEQSGWAVIEIDTVGSSDANFLSAINTNNDFFTFTINPDAGYQFTVNSISLIAQQRVNHATNAAVFADLGSGLQNIGTSTIAFSDKDNYVTQTINLTGVTDQQSALQFYIPITKSDGGTGIGINLYSGTDGGVAVSVDGDVSVIPEPQAGVLISGFLGIFLLIRRRRG